MFSPSSLIAREREEAKNNIFSQIKYEKFMKIKHTKSLKIN